MNSARIINNNYDYQPTNDHQSLKIETGIGPITDKILNDILNRLTTDNFKEKLSAKIIEPLTTIINEKIQPYINISIGLYIIVIVLLLIIIYFLIRKIAKQ